MIADEFVIAQMGGRATPLCAFSVYGTPEPKGSMTAMLRGRRCPRGCGKTIDCFAQIVPGHNHKRKDGTRGDTRQRNERWRTAVATAASTWWLTNGRPAPLDGALEVWANFYLPRPKSVRAEFPVGPPDVDKLARQIGDVLQDAKIIFNDSRIIAWHPKKLYAPPGIQPHARIVIDRPAL